MKLAFDTVDLDDLSIDQAIQIRDVDHVLVARFAALYEDEADLPPIIVMVDSDDKKWLVDGFARWRACTRIGRQGLRAEVRHGSLEMARFAAAGANKGVLKTDEQRRAVALALTTPEGRKLSHKDLARHVGVTRAFVESIVSGGETVGDKRKQTAVNVEAAIRDAWARDPTATTEHVARTLGVHKSTAAAVRDSLGIKSARGLANDKLARAERLWGINPDITLQEMTRVTGASRQGLRQVRDRLGVPAQDCGAGRRAADKSRVENLLRREAELNAPSAPPRRANDSRAGSDDKVAYLEPPNSRVLGAMAAVEQLDGVEKSRLADILVGRWPSFFSIPVSKTG